MFTKVRLVITETRRERIVIRIVGGFWVVENYLLLDISDG